MKEIITLEDFENLLKCDKRFKKAWLDYVRIEALMAMQPPEMRKRIDEACREYVKKMNDAR